MIKLIVVVAFWVCAAVGAVYGYAVIVDDYELQNKVMSQITELKFAWQQFVQNIQMTIDGWIGSVNQSAESAKQAAEGSVNEVIQKIPVPVRQ